MCIVYVLQSNPNIPFYYCRYGHEIYQHAQHWMTMSHTSGWAFYKPSTFTECENPGHHACLDQYLADGNLHFKSP